ncbi:MAG: radical SAM protein [Candidatus Theseobacter exili]|nr:radical SAM protein [Candidatus Theseobacter exili]
MNILLVKPAWFNNGLYKNCHLARVPPINLGILASLSDGHYVKIADEDVEAIPYSDKWNIVGITTATSTANNAYEIADRFKQLGCKVILGGIHPSLLPDEASLHADSIIVGEAERLWREILADFPKLSRVYTETKPVEPELIPLPRRDLFHPSYITAPLQATRGCVRNCDYCYLQSVPWKKYRKRPISNLAKELSQIKQRYIFVVDDNLFLDTNYALDFAEMIRPFNKYWWAQAPLSLGTDKKTLKKFADSGMCAVSLGIDSVIKESLESVSKTHDPIDEAKKIVKNFHDLKIGVATFLVFGFETDQKDVFQRSLETIDKLNIDCGAFFCLTPYPGTKMFDRMEKEGRILTKDWSKYDWLHAVFKPAGLLPRQLEKGTLQMYPSVRRIRLKKLFQSILISLRMISRSPAVAFHMKDFHFLRPRGGPLL